MAESRNLPIKGWRRVDVAGFAFVAAMLAALSGCGSDDACIQWSEREGACPAQEDAKPFMTPMGPINNNCGGILSVDSEGEFDGTACCYEVTKSETNQYCY